MEPSLAIDNQVCNLGLPVITFCDGITLQQDLVILPELQLYAVQQATYRAHAYSSVPSVSRYRCRALRKAIAYNHHDTCRTDKFLHLSGYRGTCRGEEVMAFQAQRLQQQRNHRLLVEEVLHLQGQRRKDATHLIVDVILPAHTQGILQHLTLDGAAVIYLFLHTSIDLFPETGNGTHTGRMHLA